MVRLCFTSLSSSSSPSRWECSYTLWRSCSRRISTLRAVLPSSVIVGMALAMGIAVYRHGWEIRPLTTVGFVAVLLLVWAGIQFPIIGPSLAQWKWLLLFYAFAASVPPVWMLLQPRDYINSLLLYVGVGAMYVGFFYANPSFAAPAVELRPEGAPPMFPFVFIVIACGAASGFHALVSSGTSAKQLDRETDAPFIGYGAMIGESLLGLMAVLACTSGFVSREDWLARYVSWQAADGLGNNIAAFISGTTQFLTTLGFPADLASTFVAVLVVSFALTSVDSGTRLLRYNISEVGETMGLPALDNRYVASGLAVMAIAFFAFYQVGGEFAGLILISAVRYHQPVDGWIGSLGDHRVSPSAWKAPDLYLGTDAVHAGVDAVSNEQQPARLLGQSTMAAPGHRLDDLPACDLVDCRSRTGYPSLPAASGQGRLGSGVRID